MLSLDISGVYVRVGVVALIGEFTTCQEIILNKIIFLYFQMEKRNHPAHRYSILLV